MQVVATKSSLRYRTTNSEHTQESSTYLKHS